MNSGRTDFPKLPPKTPRLQFSIWTALVLTTATAIVLSMRHYVPHFVDVLFADLVLYTFLVLAILGAVSSYRWVRRGISRLLQFLARKLGLERFWLFRFARRIAESLYRLFLRRGLAANHRGNALCREGQYDRAIVEYSKAIELEGRLAAMPYFNRGWAWYKKGDLDRAVADYESSLRLDPCLALAHCARALVFIAKREFDQAIEDCDVSIRLDGRQWAAFVNRGIALVEKGLPDQALRDLDEAILRNPNWAEAYRYRAKAWQEMGYPDLARSDLDDAIKQDRNSFQLRRS
jgi:tetratricopeptide (TPR) repeat protein